MRSVAAASILFSLLILSACGGSDAPAWQKAADGAVLVKLHVNGHSISDMKYVPSRITVPANSKVRLSLYNDIKTEGLYQNFVLVTLGSGQEVVNDANASGSSNNYVPGGSNVMAASTLAAPGDSVVVEFRAPASGSYNFISTFPGNFPKLIGKFSVE
jgi:azurin